MCQAEKVSEASAVGTEQSKSRIVDAPSRSRTRRRNKRDRNDDWLRKKEEEEGVLPSPRRTKPRKRKVKKQSAALKKHGNDGPSGGVEAMIPSLIGVGVLVLAVMAQQGFRGRASVAGIDLGTTNSVICVQAPSKGVGKIDCIPDPVSGSPIIPSVVSFLEPHERKVGPSSKIESSLVPHPSHVVVGTKAKHRIDTHPARTLYHAKRVLGRPADDPAVAELRREVEYAIVERRRRPGEEDDEDGVTFRVDDRFVSPRQVGSYVVFHLLQIARSSLGHDNLKSAVLAVPAKFDARQRRLTAEAFRKAGLKISRVLEEPAAAALAYGLNRKDGVEKILVYDFGGGTLDVSILHVSDGYVEVMGSDGDDRLGGADFDAAIARSLSDKHGEETIPTTATTIVDVEALSASCPRITDDLPLCTISSFHTLGERMKIGLSGDGRARAACLAAPPPPELPEDGGTVSCDDLQERILELSREEFYGVAGPLFDRSLAPIVRLMGDLDLKPDDVQEIVMVGGTTRMPKIREIVSDWFENAQLNTHIDPDLTVAYGAASVVD